MNLYGIVSIFSVQKHKLFVHCDIYIAVLGGGPGSFGIITNIYLRAYSDYDFHDNIYWQLEWDYTPQLFKKIGYQFADLFNSDYYRNDPNKYIGLDITDQIITYYGWWIKINNDMKYKFNTNIIEDFRNIGYARVIVPLPYNIHQNNGYNGKNNNGNNNNGYDNGNNNGNNGNNNDYNNDISGSYNTITYNYMNYVLKDIDYWQYEQPMLNQKQYSNNNLNYDVIDIINYTPFYAPSPDFQEIPIIIERDCNGDRSCEGAQFNGTNIKEIKCNGDISCSNSIIIVCCTNQ